MSLEGVLEAAAAVWGGVAPPAGEPPLRAVHRHVPRAITETPCAVLVPVGTEVERGGGLRRLRHTLHMYLVLPPSPDAQAAQRSRTRWLAAVLDAFDQALTLGGAASRSQVERVEHGTITVADREYVVANFVLVAWEEEAYTFRA